MYFKMVPPSPNEFSLSSAVAFILEEPRLLV